MDIFRSYSVKIKHYNRIFMQSVKLYREAVDFFIRICLDEWNVFEKLNGVRVVNAMEKLTIRTAKRPVVKYDFSLKFYKFPSYLRRSAIAEAFGKASSYVTMLEKYQNGTATGRPGYPTAGHIYPVLYQKNCFLRTGVYRAKIKVYIRNTWDWLEVQLKKSDADYIIRHCSVARECSPTLQRRGKEWTLDFPYLEQAELRTKKVTDQVILGVDLGINSACVCTAMRADGTVMGREFLNLPVEKDRLKKAVGRIRKAQQHGNRKTPGLWAKAGGENEHIAVKTAAFIMEEAEKYRADVIVFEHLDLRGKKKGSKKQRLHLWKARYVQRMVETKAHRKGMRISRVNACGTSRLAYDGSGKAERGIDGNYSICRFQSGKIYNCDLNASYNIGARYYIREIIKSLPETERLVAEAKVPECTRRSTCTLSTLINLYAAVTA